MSKVLKKWIANNAVGAAKIQLENDSFLRARNAADSADINILKVNSSDAILFNSVPQVAADPSNDNDLARKVWIDQQIAATGTSAEWQSSCATAEVDSAELTPVANMRVLINGTGLNDFVGEDNKIAVRNAANDAWSFVSCSTGTFVSADDESDKLYYFGGSSWVAKNFENTTASTGLTKVDADIRLADASASNGIQVSSGAISAVVDDSSIEINGSNQLQVKALGITDAMLAGSISDGKLSADYIQTSEVDGTTIEFGSGSLNVKAGGIGETELSSSVDAESFVLSDGYVAAAGTVAIADTIEEAIEKLDGNIGALDTDDVDEGSNLYYTDARAIAAPITGFTSGAGSLEATDTVLEAIQKLDGNIAEAVGSVNGLESITLDGDDISNGYVDLAQEVIAASIHVNPVGGLLQVQGVDYTLSVVSDVTRITFAGDLASELASGDKLIVQYEY